MKKGLVIFLCLFLATISISVREGVCEAASSTTLNIPLNSVPESKAREFVLKKDRWNLQALYPSLKAWEKDYRALVTEKTPPYFGKLAQFSGKLNSPEIILEALSSYFDFERRLGKLSTYTHLLHDTDIGDSQRTALYNRAASLCYQFSAESSWLVPELLAADEALLQSPKLSKYRFFLDGLIKQKTHTLSKDEEKLLAQVSEPLASAQKAFTAISNADFKFGKVVDQNGQEHELTHASYNQFLCSNDPVLRKNSFQKYFAKYAEFQNCLSELLAGQVQSHLFFAKARKYSSPLQAALLSSNIDENVYRSLIQTVRANISVLHDYLALRKKVLGVKELHTWDLSCPLVPSYELKLPFDESCKIVIESVAPLGKEYQAKLQKGLIEDRWVDRYENQNKRSGAYSGGCFDSFPYILMNYKGTLNDLFTLAHESGHSMHSLLSRSNQPFHMANYEIFVAEVASTFNEELLMRKLLNEARSKKERAYLLNQKLDDIQKTLFRQTMFAEFELIIHEACQNSIPLTPKFFRDEYLKLMRFYYGESVVLDENAEIEWARIPHFYYNFYVYQYATGISAAYALIDNLATNPEKAQADYLHFLQSGSSNWPVELLRDAGVDMRSPKATEQIIKKFAAYTRELESLTL